MDRIFRITLALLFVFMLGLAGCKTRQSIESTPDPDFTFLQQTWSRVNIAGGIDENEAWTLAQSYFASFFGACGGATSVKDAGDRWEVETRSGYAGTPFDPIFVDKKTGTISCARGPTISPPLSH